MKIDDRGHGIYEVLSDSGKTYHVRYCGSGDADPEYVALWECDCPAGQHGRDCKHLAAVLAQRDETDEKAEEDYRNYEDYEYHPYGRN